MWGDDSVNTTGLVLALRLAASFGAAVGLVRTV